MAFSGGGRLCHEKKKTIMLSTVKSKSCTLTYDCVCSKSTTDKQTHAKEADFCLCNKWGHIWHESCTVKGVPIKTIMCLQASSQHRCQYLCWCLNRNNFCHVCMSHTHQHAQHTHAHLLLQLLHVCVSHTQTHCLPYKNNKLSSAKTPRLR